MSLQSRLASFITAVGADIKALTNGMPRETVYITIPGPMSIRTGTVKAPVPTGTYTIAEVRAVTETAPTGQALIFDVNVNGTTIYSGGTGRLSIAASAISGTDGTPSTTSVTGGTNWFTVDVDQIGSGTVGGTVTLAIELVRTS